MGEDIHFRVMLKTRNGGQYVNAHDVCDWNPEYSHFKQFFDGRNYDVFSLFGSNRGNYPELPYANYGLPDFMQGTVFDEYCLAYGFYGFVWWKLPDMRRAVDEYLKQIYNPLLFYEGIGDDENALEEWSGMLEKAQGEGVDSVFAVYREWLHENEIVIKTLENTRKTLRDYDGLKLAESPYSNIIDVDETVFLVFFDN